MTLSNKDRFQVAMMAFFMVVAVVLELPWILYRYDLVALAGTTGALGTVAKIFSVYGDCDRAYFDMVTPLSSGLEMLNVYVTQFLHLWLIYAIVKKKVYRNALQLIIGSYLSYSVVLYFWSAHISGYELMRYKSWYTFGLFYGVNMPWLAFNLYLAWDACRIINAQFRRHATS